MVAEVGEETIPFRPNRHYPRAKRKPPYRYHCLGPTNAIEQTHQLAIVEIALS
jgi:hypothetical protein